MRINRLSWALLLVVGSLPSSGCDNATDLPDTGEISVSVTTSGPEPDGNGYRAQLDETGGRSLGVEDSTVFEQVTPGSHDVELIDVAPNCTVSDESSHRVTVTVGGRAEVPFQVECVATAALRVTTRSDGAPADGDGYQLVLPDRGPRPIDQNESITMTGFLGDRLRVQLTGVVAGCTVAGGDIREVPLVAGDTAEVAFEVHCAPPPPAEGSIVVTVHTTAILIGLPTGYTLTLDGGRPTAVQATQSVTLDHVPAGAHSVRLTGLPSYCGVGFFGTGSNPVQVSVTRGRVTTVSFGVMCIG